jgi:hypothetical protein
MDSGTGVEVAAIWVLTSTWVIILDTAGCTEPETGDDCAEFMSSADSEMFNGGEGSEDTESVAL